MAKAGARGHVRTAALPSRLPALGTVGTADELAELLNLSARRIRQLVELGMPRIEPGRYDLWACARWYIAFLTRAIAARREPPSPELAVESLRLLAAKRRLRQLTLAEQRGDVAPLDSVADSWERAIEVLRARMVNAANRLAPSLVDLASERDAFAVLSAEVLAALAEADEIARARE